MRKIVVNLVVLLTVTGLLVGYGGTLALGEGTARLLSLVHYWGGLLFLVIFPLYAWEHIGANRHWLRAWRTVTLSGVVQTAAAVLLILTGLVLMVYGVQTWLAVREAHHWLTYPLAAVLALHFLARKDWRG